MYIDDMKPLIKYALELKITNLKTFQGYKGGDIIMFEADDTQTIKLIKKYCHKLETDTNIKGNKIYCHFGIDRLQVMDSDFEIYELK